MKDLISREAVLEGKFPEVENEYQMGWNDALEGAALALPTVDAVEVVRCAECKHWLPYLSLGVNYCSLHTGLVLTKEDTYCSYAERKE